MNMLSSSTFVERIGWTLLHSLWQLAALAMVVWFVDQLLRRAKANTRYVALVVALFSSVVLPVATFAWLSPLEDRSPQADAPNPVLATDLANIPGESDRVPPTTVNVKDLAEFSVTEPQTQPITPPSPSAQNENEPVLAWTVAVSNWMRPHLATIVVCWWIGFCGFALRPLLSLFTVWRLRRVGKLPVNDPTRVAMQRVSKQLGFNRAIAVYESSLAQVPMVLGYLKPMILLPTSVISGLSVAQIEAVLAHELTHIRRHDYLVNIFQTIVETTFFYHPAVWWLSRRVRVERENCCDDVAVAVSGDRLAYGRVLLTLEDLRASPPTLAMGLRTGSLAARIRRIVNAKPASTLPGNGLACSTALMLGILVASWAILFADRQPNLMADDTVVSLIQQDPTQWSMLGGTPSRNNVSSTTNIPQDWDLDTGKNIRWAADIGSVNYGSPVVAGGRVLVGTNNELGRNPKYPAHVDLACLMCFDEESGKFLWQFSSEKLPAGRDLDWPTIGLCSTPCVVGDRVWLTTNRTEVVCLDLEGFRDIQNDGPVQDETDAEVEDADVIWRFDMTASLGVLPKFQSCSSPVVVEELVLLNTSNSLDQHAPNKGSPDAPSFLALNRHTGHVVWQDASPGKNILGAQCPSASPAVVEVGGVVQAIFAGGDGWIYAFDFAQIRQGRTKLLWKFDTNPKTARYGLGARFDRNIVLAAPVVVNDRVYVATGQNPEHGEGTGILWCIDATKRGDLSSELVFNRRDPSTPIAHKAVQACEPDKGDFTRENPNSGVVWQYAGEDVNQDGKLSFEEEFHRTCGSVTIHNGIAYVADFSGLLHAIDASSGKPLWYYDLFAMAWSTPVVVDGRVFITDEDGEVAILKTGRTKELLAEVSMRSAIYSTPAAANETLFLGAPNKLLAIQRSDASTDGPSIADASKTPSKNPTVEIPSDESQVAEHGEIRGRLVDEATGKPVAGVLVACGAIINDSGRGGGARDTTDENGEYRLAVPSPGIYTVWIKEVDDYTKTAAADDGLLVQAGKVTQSKLEFVTGKSIKGVAVDAAGTPIANLRIMCSSAARPFSLGSVQSTLTTEDGEFEIALPAGGARVYASRKKVQDAAGNELGHTGFVDFEVPAAGDAPQITLRLGSASIGFGSDEWLSRSTPGTKIVDHKNAADVVGTVVDTNGDPIPGAMVFRYDGPRIPADKGGKFRVSAKRGTQFVMYAFHPEHRVWFGAPTAGDELKIVLVKKNASSSLSADEARRETRDRQYRVRLVEAADGKPIPNMQVNALCWSGPHANEIDAVGITDSHGWVTFDNLRDTYYKWRLAAEEETVYIPTRRGSAPGDRGEVVIEVKRACELVLRAVDAETGAGIPGVKFGRERASGEYWMQVIVPDTVGASRPVRYNFEPREGMPPESDYETDQDGYFRCLVGPERWSYMVYEFPEGYNSIVPIKGAHELEIGTPSGKRVEYTFRLVRTQSAST